MEQKRITIDGKPCIGVYYDKNDFNEMKKLYKVRLELNRVLINFGSRATNVPDFLSEGIFCYLFNVCRTNAKGNSKSFDAYDERTNEGIQIKSTSIENDCTSFGPTSTWDKIYFMKFYPKSESGRVEIYDITSYPPYDFVLNHKKHETFRDQQLMGRRPRFSIQDLIIDPNNLKPIKTINLFEGSND